MTSTKMLSMLSLNRLRSFLELETGTASCRCLYSSLSNFNSSTQTQAEQKEDNKEWLSENDQVNPNFVNRNPRNLERMAVARKDKGWSQSYPRRDYWHKLIVTKSNRHIKAHIEHYRGNIVVQASTKEWAIKQHLYSTSDVSASENLGRMLAQRCMESGINYCHVNMEKNTLEQEGMASFINALEEGGLILHEPRNIVDFTIGKRPDSYFPEVD